jgi:hypothetical protein
MINLIISSSITDYFEVSNTLSSDNGLGQTGFCGAIKGHGAWEILLQHVGQLSLRVRRRHLEAGAPTVEGPFMN